MILVAATATTARLGGGGVELPLGRILVALLFCLVIAALAILLIRQRTGRGDLAGWLRRLAPARGAVEIVEVRRLSLHAELGLIRHAGREYLLLLQAGSTRVLCETDSPPAEPAA